MLAHEVLRAAAKLIEAGWSEGKEPARDADGRPVPLYSGTGGGTSRAGINPQAARFSAYGAIAVVLAKNQMGGTAHMWGKLADAAAASMEGRKGGTNFVHPLIGFNATEGRTAAEVVSLLLDVAGQLEPAKSSLKERV
jgi:hypothetical protein